MQTLDKRAITLRIPEDTIFSSLSPTKTIKPNIDISLTEYSYEPKVSDPKYDWVASAAIPAMLALREKFTMQGQNVKEFCTIGTGTGTDALAAMEIFNPSNIVVTDIHQSVVDHAVKNIKTNLIDKEKVTVNGVVGDLCAPLLEAGYKFDLIYENLPNIRPCKLNCVTAHYLIL